MPPSGDNEMPGRGACARADQVRDRLRDLVRADHAADRLACLQRRALGLRVVGLGQQALDPRRVRGAWVHAVHADALAHVVGGHRQREREDRALGRAVERALRDAGGGCDRRGVADRRVLGLAQVGQRRAGDAHDPEDVDVEHAAPLVVVVVGDGALGADAGVVDQDVQPAEALGGLLHRRPHRAVVGHVGLHADQPAARPRRRRGRARPPARRARAACAPPPAPMPDAPPVTRAAQPVEGARAHLGIASSAHTGPYGYACRSRDSACISLL